MIQRVRLSDLVTDDPRLRVRVAALGESVVAEYHRRIVQDRSFPPPVLVVAMHDLVDLDVERLRLYLINGFARVEALRRVGVESVDADVHQFQSFSDAMWLAAAQNQDPDDAPLSREDRFHAAQMAIHARPQAKRDDIRAHVKVGTRRIVEARESLGRIAVEAPSSREMSRSAKEMRHAQLVRMASEGYSADQIASALGYGVRSVQNLISERGIRFTAPSRLRKHDSGKILEQIVIDAEGLVADAAFVAAKNVDREKLAGYVRALRESHRGLGAFIKQLTQELDAHV